MIDPLAPPSSLRSSEGHPVPLLGVALGGEVFGAHARLVVRQRYRNDEKKPIEAIYTFPLPSDAVLVGFAMECDGRRLEGEVKEREEAFRTYDEAITKGHGAALLDQERRNVFTANVGNLLPGEETVVEVTYVQRLGADEGALRLMIPTLVAPRYIPGTPSGDRTGHGTAEPTDRVPDADRISPRIGAVAYGLALDLVFDLGREITVESPSHAIVASDAGARRRRVTFASDAVALDRDLVLTAAGAEAAAQAAGVVAEKRPGAEGTFALTVVPDLFDARRAAARDVVFVVDVSGSMGGASIEQARTALRLCLRQLSEGDRFNVIAFSSSFRSFQPGLVPFTQATLQTADRWVAALVADGGTEMLEPLLAAVGALAPGKDAERLRDRLVVLLTDGEVGNEAEIVDQVAARAAGARVYAFGIGTNVSDLLVGDLGRRTRGGAEYIHPGERIDDKVTAQFARATAARVEDVTVKLVGVDGGELAPAELPALVDGEPWVLYGRFESPGLGHAEIRGTLRGERFYLEVPIELPAEASRPGLAALWAGARIRDLEEGERGLSGRRAEASKKRIAELSVAHGVGSKYASFVVVEKRTGDRRAQGQPEARPVPVNAPAGWAMFERAEMDRAMSASLTRAGAVGRAAPPPPPMGRAMAPMVMKAKIPGPAMGAGMPPPPPAMASPMPARGKAIALDATPPTGAPPPAQPAPAEAADVFAEMAELDDGIDYMTAVSGAPSDEGTGTGAGAAGSPERALFERQLASGLWEGDGGDASRLMATARALAACFAGGIDSAHALYGAQVKKAVAAVCALAADLARRGEGEREIMAALAAAFLVASGPRLRRDVLAVVEASGSAGVQSLAAHLTSRDAARLKLTELGA